MRSEGAVKVCMAVCAVVGVLCLATSQVALADAYQPSHSCSKPFKPYKFTSEWEVRSFEDEVERYKRCIENFVEEQNRAVKNHREAASDAIADWNRFVKYDLR